MRERKRERKGVYVREEKVRKKELEKGRLGEKMRENKKEEREGRSE